MEAALWNAEKHPAFVVGLLLAGDCPNNSPLKYYTKLLLLKLS